MAEPKKSDIKRNITDFLWKLLHGRLKAGTLLSSSYKENSMTKDNQAGDTSGDKSRCPRYSNRRDLALTYVLHHPVLLVSNFGDRSEETQR